MIGPATSAARCFGYPLAAAVFAASLCVLPPLPAHAAGGAFVVDDTDIAKAGDCKVESYVSKADNGDFLVSSTPACVFNLLQPVEIGTQFQRFRFGGIWDTTLTVKAKTNIVDYEKNPYGLAVSGGTSFDLITGENLGSYVNVPFSLKVGEQWRVNLNVGSLYDNTVNRLWLTWGAGFEWNFVKQFTLLGEVFGQLGHNDPMFPDLASPRAQLGLRYNPVENIDVDVIYGRNISGVDANWITLGVNVRFTAFASK
jgi:hypothetical protein